MTGLRWANLILAALAVLAPMAHVLELPNKLALDGALWLAVQQHLYRGWGPFFGAPVEIGVFGTTLALLIRRRRGRIRRLTLLATLAYAGMLAAFFVFNAPVNAALNRWTAASLPADWAAYRLRWETGHAVAAFLSIVGLIAVVRAWIVEASELWQTRGVG